MGAGKGSLNNLSVLGGEWIWRAGHAGAGSSIARRVLRYFAGNTCEHPLLIPPAFLAGEKDNRISIAIEEPIYLTSMPNFEQLQDVLRGDSPAVEVLNGRVVSAPGALEGVLGGVREELSLGWGTGSGPGRRHTKFLGVCECCGSSAVPGQARLHPAHPTAQPTPQCPPLQAMLAFLGCTAVEVATQRSFVEQALSPAGAAAAATLVALTAAASLAPALAGRSDDGQLCSNLLAAGITAFS